MNKPALYLLSGLLCDSTVWDEVSENLGDIVDVTIMSFEGLESITMMAQQVLDHAPLEFMLIGHSMGGRVALEVYRQSPERVEKLGLFNTGVHSRKSGELESRQKLLDLAYEHGMSAVAEAWLTPMMSQASLSDEVLMAKLTGMVENYQVGSFVGQIKALLERPNAESILPLVDVPTLLLSGSEDQWSPVVQHELMKQKIHNSRLVVVEKAGHMAPVEKPVIVSGIIRDWLLGLHD